MDRRTARTRKMILDVFDYAGTLWLTADEVTRELPYPKHPGTIRRHIRDLRDMGLLHYRKRRVVGAPVEYQRRGHAMTHKPTLRELVRQTYDYAYPIWLTPLEMVDEIPGVYSVQYAREINGELLDDGTIVCQRRGTSRAMEYRLKEAPNA